MDQTAALNERLAHSGPLVDLGGETFTCDWPVIIPAGVEARNATIIRPTDGSGLTPPAGAKQSWRRNLAHVRVNGQAADLHLQGPGATFDPATEGQHGFALGPGAAIWDSTVRNVLGDGISFGEQSGCSAHHVEIDGCGRQGMSWVHGDDGLIEDCTFTRVARTVIDLEPMATLSHIVRRFTARRIDVGTYGNRIIGAGSSGEVHDVTIDGLNVPAGWLAVEIEGGPRTAFTFRGMVGTKPKTHPAFSLNDVHGVLIDGCSQPFAGKTRPPAVRAVACTGVEVRKTCTWTGASTTLATT